MNADCFPSIGLLFDVWAMWTWLMVACLITGNKKWFSSFVSHQWSVNRWRGMTTSLIRDIWSNGWWSSIAVGIDSRKIDGAQVKKGHSENEQKGEDADKMMGN